MSPPSGRACRSGFVLYWEKPIQEVRIMFCPVCWKEYPKGMRHCDHCRVDLIEEKPKEAEGQKPSQPETPADKKTEKGK
jgi:predicted amidophosphoribosyltransferase